MRTLILVDIQNDFSSTGTLPVPGGETIVPLVNQLQARFELVVATKDWHPGDHKSFASRNDKKPGDVMWLNGIEQILWPDHCIQGSTGAEFIPGLDTSRIDKVILKGTDPEVDSYSAFFDNRKGKATGLDSFLREKKVRSIHIAGLATDYCVLFTALDAVSLGYDTWVIEDAVRGVNLHPGDVGNALAKMQAHGIRLIRSDAFL